MTSTATKPSPFDNVPNEVFNLILSFIPMKEKFSAKNDDGSSHKIHQILALMHVSRQFRYAMLQHKVWHDVEFEFEDLATAADDDYTYFNQFYPTTVSAFDADVAHTNLPARIANLCNALFHDSYFRQCINKKTDWSFASLDVLFAVLAYLPSFTNSAQAVVLDLEGIDVAIPRLRDCKNLVRLEIRADSQPSLNLSSISRFLPSLKILEIHLPIEWTGSLEELSGLEEFLLNVPQGGSWECSEMDFPESLPLASANTLTRMNLRKCYFSGRVSLKMFESLKHLRTIESPVDDELADLINDLPVRLCSLASAVEIPCPRTRQELEEEGMEMEEQFQLLSCLCLAQLKTIELSMPCNRSVPDDESFVSYYVENCMKVVSKMVDKMPLLEEVELWGGLDMNGVHVLGRLQNLKKLRWIVSEDRYVKGMGSGDLTSQVVEIFTPMGKKVDSVIIEIAPYDAIKYEADIFDASDEESDESDEGSSGEGSFDEEAGIFW
jgi:F-box domain